MREFFIKWFVNFIALLLVVRIIAGIHIDNWQTAVMAALVIGLLNAFLRPLIIMLTLPFNIVSLGVFTLFINGFMLYLASKFVSGFYVETFWNAFWAALLFSIIGFFLNLLFSISASGTTGHYSVRRSYNKPSIDVSDDVIDVDATDEQ